MKSALTLIFIVAFTLFAPVSNAATSSYAATDTYQRATRTGTSSYTYNCNAGSYYAIHSSATISSGVMSDNFPSACDGATRHAIWANTSNNTYYWWGESQPSCPTNSTLSGSTCNANAGYEFDDEGNIQEAEPPQCAAWETINIGTNECEAMQCPEGTYFSGILQACTARDPQADCELGENIALSVSKNGAIPMFQDAYGCSWAIDESIPEANRKGCITTNGVETCTAWYTSTGNAAPENYCEQNPTLCDEPYSGSNPDAGGGGSGDPPVTPDPEDQSNPDNNGAGGEDGSGADGEDGNPDECELDPYGEGCPLHEEPEPEEEDRAWVRPTNSQQGFDDLNSDVQTAKERLMNRFDSIKQEIGGSFAISIPSSAALPCDSVDLGAFGTFELCISNYSEQLTVIGQIILAIGTLLTIFIIMS